MKKLLKITGASLLALGLLTACNTEEAPEDTPIEEVEDDTATEDSTETEEATDDEKTDDGVPSTTGDFEDQVDLRLGDTAKIASNTGVYEITIHSARFEDEIDGQASHRDYFMVIDLTIKNIGEIVIDAYRPVDILDQTANLEGSGSGDFSSSYESINAITGDLPPGEEVTGQAVFNLFDAEKQFIRVKSGLVASGAVHNDAVWTIEKSEME